MTERSAKWSAGAVLMWTAIGATFIFSLWLRRAFPIFALANAIHDDLLFVSQAAHLLALEWLGPYDQMTLAKGSAYSAFMALNYLAGLPLKTTEHVVYLLACLVFSTTMGRLFQSRIATIVVFMALAFNPTLWAADVGGRVVRENLYLSLSLLLVALAVRVFVLGQEGSWLSRLRAQRYWLVAFGLTGAAFWLTREEGAWLAPALLVLAGYWMVRTWREGAPGQRSIHAMAPYLLLPALGFLAVVGAVNAVNFAAYGVFRNNDFRSPDFQGAYGAVSRITHDRWRSHVVFPRDARERAYAVSPAAAELRPFFEGQGGANWVAVSCANTAKQYCDEIHVGWFMWAFRDAVTFAGHYQSGRDTQRFYRRLAREIDAACDRGDIPCSGRRETMIPVWHPSYLPAIAKAAASVFHTLATFEPLKAWTAASIGSAEQVALFARITHGPLSTDLFHGPDDARAGIASALLRAQKQAMKIVLPASLALWALLLVAAAIRRWWHPGHVVVAALVAAMGMRVALLAVLEATSMPSNNMLYLSPAVPMALALGPCVAFLLVAYLREAGLTRAPRSGASGRSAT
ncbi:MAG TPA: hypothetical protein VM073_11445 [Usitatibacter sp.]|nr:hypothetical protein [Usitatibacter sp.]